MTVFAYRVFREVFKFIFKFLKFDFGCAGSSLLRGFFSSCGTQVLIVVASILDSTGSRAQGLQWVWLPRLQGTGSVVVAHGLSCSMACGIFPDQGSNLCLLLWQADSLSLSHQVSPMVLFY